MSATASDAKPVLRTRIAGVSSWLFYSVLTIVLWGAWGVVSKIASAGVDAYTNQIFFTLGLLPLIMLVLWSARLSAGTQRKQGIAWAFLTGILGGSGNIAFFHALVIGGKVSIVVPATALFPIVTVILATTVLRERLGKLQILGFVLALIAIYLLSI
jgi:transporter family protein